jgi:hypothetical protein
VVVYGPRSDFPNTLPYARKVEVPLRSYVVVRASGQVEALDGARFTATYEAD